ncbi:ribosomal L1 domain-containing protein 1-like [Aethina tumida]|uniref:ribosomal L1 domain-containing protein 1-like n=1 Tax=Aethina tumida TaxID=116153 RepID=UPI0021495D44|nr:ribosomal L1 domain-containing protein 1-like [Aethina tumida]
MVKIKELMTPKTPKVKKSLSTPLKTKQKSPKAENVKISPAKRAKNEHLDTPRPPKIAPNSENDKSAKKKSDQFVTPKPPKQVKSVPISENGKSAKKQQNQVGLVTPKSAKQLKSAPPSENGKSAKKQKQEEFVTPKVPKQVKPMLNSENGKSVKKQQENQKSPPNTVKGKAVKRQLEQEEFVTPKPPKQVTKSDAVSENGKSAKKKVLTPKQQSPKGNSAKKIVKKLPKGTPGKILKTHKNKKLSDFTENQETITLTGKKVKTEKTLANFSKIFNSDVEKKYKISASDVEKAITNVIHLAKTNPKLQNQLFNEKIPLFLQVNSIKISKGHAKLFRLPLKHSLLTPDDEICLIVPDIKGIKNKEHEKHLEQYEELLTKKGVNNIKKVMTFHEFRTEYETFELRNRLVDLYDHFLVDGRISGKVVRKCGKIFYKKRKVPNPIKLQVTKLKEHVEQSLCKTQFTMSAHSGSHLVQFGHSKMETKDLVENLFSLIEGLDKLYPGGFKNIRNLHVFTQRAASIPIFINLANQNKVKTPTTKRSKTKGAKSVKGELTTLTNVDVVVSRDGDVKVIKQDGEKEHPDEFGVEDLLKLHKKKKFSKRAMKKLRGKSHIVVENANGTVKEEKKEKKQRVLSGRVEKKWKKNKVKKNLAKLAPKKKVQKN